MIDSPLCVFGDEYVDLFACHESFVESRFQFFRSADKESEPGLPRMRANLLFVISIVLRLNKVNHAHEIVSDVTLEQMRWWRSLTLTASFAFAALEEAALFSFFEVDAGLTSTLSTTKALSD